MQRFLYVIKKRLWGLLMLFYLQKNSLNGEVIVAFSDTLFRGEFKGSFEDNDGFIWVKEVENPNAFWVVKLNDNNHITDFVEKPTTPVSNLAIIGIYYFKDGENLKN